ncbi:MAG TPA: SDR family oxidoreductase [Rhizomicrobium sp.]|nr:SDR family oxidoreductase [Rhizomicrobium sp.]
MRVLITGNMGYVGSVLVGHLRAKYPDLSLIGYDAGFFARCLTGTRTPPEIDLVEQHFGDVREIPPGLLDGIDAVVHLAAISNDPMGRRFEAVTEEVNFRASIAIAQAALDAGIRSYVFASTCSVYGNANGAARSETDELAPLTAYAHSKINTERLLQHLARGDMTVTCLRFATACGMSPRLRLDLVLNDFVASALACGRIEVLSDGTPWRPLIDVRDMARAIEWAIFRGAKNGGPFLAVNAGSDACNYQVRELAEAVADAIPGSEVSINKNAAPDRRSYRVAFSLFETLAPEFLPQIPLRESIASVREGLVAMGFRDRAFRTSQHMRLNVLEECIAAGRLNHDLHWTTPLY